MTSQLTVYTSGMTFLASQPRHLWGNTAKATRTWGVWLPRVSKLEKNWLKRTAWSAWKCWILVEHGGTILPVIFCDFPSIIGKRDELVISGDRSFDSYLYTFPCGKFLACFDFECQPSLAKNPEYLRRKPQHFGMNLHASWQMSQQITTSRAWALRLLLLDVECCWVCAGYSKLAPSWTFFFQIILSISWLLCRRSCFWNTGWCGVLPQWAATQVSHRKTHFSILKLWISKLYSHLFKNKLVQLMLVSIRKIRKLPSKCWFPWSLRHITDDIFCWGPCPGHHKLDLDQFLMQHSRPIIGGCIRTPLILPSGNLT